MIIKEVIGTWRWRIVKAGYKCSKFAEEIGVPLPTLSLYMSGTKTPSVKRFDLIEGKLRDLGV